MVATMLDGGCCWWVRDCFQSPFHRGNGCYGGPHIEVNTRDKTFSPLFIGAMVATRLNSEGITQSQAFQSPFHRGNGCYYENCIGIGAGLPFFQSPFHRGNGCYIKRMCWELRDKNAFSPLFIGAMVATAINTAQLMAVL